MIAECRSSAMPSNVVFGLTAACAASPRTRVVVSAPANPRVLAKVLRPGKLNIFIFSFLREKPPTLYSAPRLFGPESVSVEGARLAARNFGLDEPSVPAFIEVRVLPGTGRRATGFAR